jgi:hypothetical protein
VHGRTGGGAAARGLDGADLAGRAEAVEDRHADVHEDDIVALGAVGEFVDGFQAVLGLVHDVVLALPHVRPEEREVDDVVVDKKQARLRW